MLDDAKFITEVREQGYSLVEDVFTRPELDELKADLLTAIEGEANYHKRNPHSKAPLGMVLFCPLFANSFWHVFDNEKFRKPFELLLGEGCIVYGYSAASMPPQSSNFASQIHVDCPRVIPNYITNCHAMVMLDDFEEANGATWVLPGSQNDEKQPDDVEFWRKGRRVLGQAGTVAYLDSRLWHAGGNNETDNWRHMFTVSMCRPWMKQRLDIPKLAAHLDLTHISKVARQKFGFLAQVPASYDEYYTVPEKRKFQQKFE